MHAVLPLTLAILADVIGTLLLEPSRQFTRPLPTAGVIASYGLSFWFMAMAVGHMPVGVLYALWAGLGVALIGLVGWLFLGQRPDAPALLGMALIVAGVAIIHLFSGDGTH